MTDANKETCDQCGIRCAQCGCRHFYTTHTEPLRDGRIRRRKVCRHCGRKIVTFEGVAGDPSLTHCQM